MYAASPPPRTGRRGLAAPAVAPAGDDVLSVLAVTPIFDNGGTEVQLLELGQGLRARGDTYRIVTGTGTRLADLAACGQPYRLVRQTAGRSPLPVELLAYAGSLLQELLAEHAHIIQSTSIRTTYAAALAATAYRCCRLRTPAPAIVTTLHGGKQTDIYGRAARHLRYLSDAVVVVSRGGRDALLQRGFPSERLHLVPPGRDLTAFLDIAAGRVQAAAIPGVPDTARVVLTVGRLSPLKGVSHLLDAWALAAPRLGDVYLVIVGTGELEPALREQAAALGMGERVIFAGFRADVPALLARAEAFVLSSLWEGLPMAAVEAMAARRPVVATAVGGTPEIVADGRTGLLVPAADAPALAAAIERLLTDIELRDRLAVAGAADVRQRFTREAMVAATRDVYQQVYQQQVRQFTDCPVYEA